jgi:uracil-DNA glycosylase
MSQDELSSLIQGLKANIILDRERGVETLAVAPQKKSAEKALKAIRDELGDCRRCALCEGRTNLVFGVGNPKTRLMFVGEGPGRDEDEQGEPFVGRAGKLLTKIIEAMNLKRSDIYIANVVKCRPPNNRFPEPIEVETCIPFLIKQISAIQPEMIVTLGNLAAHNLLKTKTGVTALRGRFHDFEGIPVMPTFHPAYLLRNPPKKREVWEDMQLVMQALKIS